MESFSLPWTKRRSLLLWFTASLISLTSGCILVGDYEDVYVDPGPQSIMYEICYDHSQCFADLYCEELALPAGPYTAYVNAICTQGCFDDLDCPFSEFNGLPGACVDHIVFGGPITSTICVERCEIDLDCDIGAGFGCEFVEGERLCVPVL